MADTKTLYDAFLDELRDAYDAEKQLLKALPKMAKAAGADELRAAFESHLEDTTGHVERLEQIFAAIEEAPRGKHCSGMAGIIDEGKAVMAEGFDGATMDACLVAAGQRAEHYEMAAYGTLRAWAHALGLPEAASLLEETLNEERAADEALTALAEGGLNDVAAAGVDDGDEDDDGEDAEDDDAAAPDAEETPVAPAPATKRAAPKPARRQRAARSRPLQRRGG